MRQILLAFVFFSIAAPAAAWNAAGHRLTAVIAWQQLSTPTRMAISAALSRHPDYTRWVDQARSDKGVDIFAEAATWPDDIRHDPRFFDDGREPATPQLPGLADTARHKRWHYVDLNPAGEVAAGELDQQIERLSRVVLISRNNPDLSIALPWLLHLVADIHQPLHVGRQGDEGGNQVEIENPFNKRHPFGNLHAFWDDLPGPPWLRGKRLEQDASRLLEQHTAPVQGNVKLWREESHRLLDEAYPTSKGNLPARISEDFRQRSRDIAERCIVAGGYRLGRLLEDLFNRRVPRETP